MPEAEDSEYYKLPRPESIRAFRDYLSLNPSITNIQQVKPHLLYISRDRMPDLDVYVANLYIVGEPDVYEILTSESSVDAIVTMSAWNSYTADAKAMCLSRGIGLFKFREFLGAAYYSGKQFLEYVLPEDRKRSEY